MQKMKKVLAWMLAAGMIVNMPMQSVWAEEAANAEKAVNVGKASKATVKSTDSGVCGEALTWALDGEGTLTISGTGDMFEYESESDVPWAAYADEIQSLIIEDGVTSIGQYAFFECTGIRTITMPKSMTKIADGAFFVYDVAEEQPEELVHVNYMGTPDDWNEIEFDEMKLSYFRVHTQGVVEGACDDNLTWRYEDGTLTISGDGDMQTTDKYCPWENYKQIIYSVVIEDGVTSVGDYAFLSCTILERVEMADSVTSIGMAAFYFCYNLKEVTLSKGLKEIGGGAFWACLRMESIEIPEGVETLEAGTFIACQKLKSISLPNSINLMKEQTFGDGMDYAPLTDIYYNGTEEEWAKVDFADQVYMSDLTVHTKGIAEGTFGDQITWELGNDGVLVIRGTGDMPDSNSPWGNHLDEIRSVVIEEGISSISEAAFKYCEALENVQIPEGVERIGYEAFWDCISLKSVVIPASVVSIGEYAFAECNSLESVIILDGTENLRKMARAGEAERVIEAGAFIGCTNLKKIVIPANITKIGENAFANCGSELVIIYAGTQEEWDQIAKGAFPEGEGVPDIQVHEHNLELQDAQAVTCVDNGYTGDKVCKDCGKTIEKGEVIPATGHTEDIRGAKEPTDTEEGYTGDVYCSVCDELLKKGEVIPATGKPGDCEGTHEVTLQEGTYAFYLNGVNMGRFTFKNVSGQWSIQNEEGKYLAQSAGKFSLSDTTDYWDYKGGKFSQTEKSNSWWFWFVGSSTYYLSEAKGTFAVSTSSKNASAAFFETVTGGEHQWSAWTYKAAGRHQSICAMCGEIKDRPCEDKDGDQYCDICGHTDAKGSVDVSVKITKKTSGFLWFKTTTYTAVIDAKGIDVDVEKVEYSTDGRNWKKGTSFTSRQEIKTFQIRVTDKDGTVTYWKYDNQNVTQLDK